MRWFWIDRFEKFERGNYAVATKNISLAEEQIDEYYAGYPIMPSSIILEGMAQTGGMLVSEMSSFEGRVVLAKVSKMVYHRTAFPGDTLTYTATIETQHDDGAIVAVKSEIGDEIQAEGQLVFAQLGDQFEGVELFEPVDFLATLRLLRIFDVGRREDGSQLEVPPWMLKAERAAQGIES